MMKALSFVVLCASILVVLLGASQVNAAYAVNQIPQWDICKNGGDFFSCTGHGHCVNDACVCDAGWQGRDCSLPTGVSSFGYPATVTQFCQLETGGCAGGMCIGGGQFDNTNLPAGVDGVAALNPTLYGSRYAWVNSQGAGSPRTPNGMYSFVGDSCGTCWKLTRASVSITVMVVDRCAGYCHSSGLGLDATCASTGSNSKECGECIQAKQSSTPQCSCLNTASRDSQGMCGGNPNAHCDWCANNDHPHFDLDITAQMKICGSTESLCSIDSFQMVPCGVIKATWPNGYYNGTDSPASLAAKLAAGTTGSSSSSSSNTNTNTNTNSNTNTNTNTNSNQASSTVATNCKISVAGSSTCTTVSQGQYVCNGNDLNVCNLGQMLKYGCPAGTVCQSGQCVLGSTNDPTFTTCPTSSSSVQTTTGTPVASTSTTGTPVVATPSTTGTPVVSTTTGTPVVITPTPTPTPTPTVSASHPCSSTKKRMATPEEELAEVTEIVNSFVQTETEIIEPLKVHTPVRSSANSLIATVVAAANLLTVVLIALYL